jgi:hypothetical protein
MISPCVTLCRFILSFIRKWGRERSICDLKNRLKIKEGCMEIIGNLKINTHFLNIKNICIASFLGVNVYMALLHI